MSLKKKTESGLLWAGLERVLVQGVELAVQIALARILLPQAFGVVATVAILMAIARSLVDSGLGLALIQRKELSIVDVSTVFLFNLAVSTGLFVILAFSAPWVAAFFQVDELRRVLPVLSFSLVLQAVGQTQMSLLSRQLAFRRLFLISFPAVVIAGVVGIALALCGFGVWALVWHMLANSALTSGLLWVFCDRSMAPRWQFSWVSLRSLFGFSTGILFANFIFQFADNMYGLVIGKVYSMSDLAFYNRARTFQRLPTFTLASIVNKVIFPVFSAIQHDSAKIKTAMRRGLPVMAFAVFPSMTLLIVAAEPLVVTLLTEKWERAAGYLQIFALIGMLYPLASANLAVVNAQGKTVLFFWITLLKIAVWFALLLATYRHGLEAIIWGQVVAAIFGFLVNAAAVRYSIGYTLVEQLHDNVPYLIGSLVAGGVTAVITSRLGIGSPLLLLITQTVVLAIVYLAWCHLFRLSGYGEALQRVRQLRLPKRESLAHSSVSGHS